ncbi:MAG: OmcA/MtrC family decaheme c-type cytochrome [Betaproteobacteria bacterium]|nr:OmcA/MtrC family decaheme c-type cytochrome [Betaproteobacteria bacterium]
MTSVLVACGGGGSDGINGTPGTPGGTTTVTSPGIQVGSLTPDQWAALEMKGQITAVTVGGPPEVTFTLTDKNGNAIVGLENNFSKAAGQALPTQRTVTATIAKLVPGANGSPNKWVNYIVVRVDPTKTTGEFSGLMTPSTDSNGTLTYLGGGQYKYRFATDITKAKAFVDASSDPFKADVGDVSYDAGLPHRVVIQIAGAARDTGNNTANGSTVAPAVNLEEPVNLVWDSAAPQRDIARIESCNACHSHLAFHGSGARVDTDFCVTCHTNQRKYAQTAATLGTTVVKFDDGTSETVPSWSKEPRKFPDGNAMRDFPIMVHSIHRGEHLPVRAMPTDPATGKNTSSDYIDEVVFPQPITNCVSCHTGTGPNATAQGDNWKNKPNRIACGACHNDIDFATGANHPGVGGVQADDSKCSTCHSADAIAKVYHISVDPVGSEGRGGYPVNTANNVPTPGYPSGQGPAIPLASSTNPPAGVPKVAFEINSVTVAAQKATIKYRILFDGAPVTFLPAGDKYLLANVDGTPQLSVTYGLIEDGVTTVADWTASKTVTVKQCRDQVATACTQTGPDASGWYTATFQSAQLLPADAKLVTAVLGINYQGLVKLDHPSYPKGIRLREPAFAMMLASGHTARRTIVEAARCNKCHNQLGVEPSFHSGARNNPQGCAIGGCHNETKSTGHTGEANDYGGGWALSAKSMIHGIHGASKRTQAFNYEATAKNLKGFGIVAYPGVLNNCEQCHVPGSYDFGNTANAAATANLLWTTDANGDMRNPNNAPSIGLSPWIKILGKGEIDYRGDPLVSSPITSACFGCHDSPVAVTHFQQNGGILLQSVSSITGATPGVPGTTAPPRSFGPGRQERRNSACSATPAARWRTPRSCTK